VPDQLGPYELRAELSRGASAVFWRAWDPAAGQDVTVLQPLIPAGVDEVTLAEYATEFKWQGLAATGLSHPGIVKVLGTAIVDERPIQVLEPVEGESLRRRLSRGPLEPPAALAMVEALLEALAYAHEQGVVHGDINPDSVFLQEPGQVKLAGFGVPHVGDDPALTRSGTVMGTPGYLAPEQIGEDPVDARADLFAVGVLAHEVLTGRNPFGASEGLPANTVMYRTVYRIPPEIPESLVAGLPRDIRPALLVALVKEPKGRYQDAAGFLAALRGETPVTAAGAAGLVATSLAAAGGSPPPASPPPAPPAQPGATPGPASPSVVTAAAASAGGSERRVATGSSSGPSSRRKWMLALGAGAVVVALALVASFALAGGFGEGDGTTMPPTTAAAVPTTTTTTATVSTTTTVETLSTTTSSLTTTTVPGKELATVTLGDMTVTYNGLAREVAVSTDPAGLKVVVTYSQAGNPVTAPTDAGTYEVLATIEDEKYQGSAVGILTINKANAIINVNGWTGMYTGTPHGATGTARGVRGEDLSGRLSLGASFTNVPGGRAYWTYEGGTNYNGASGSVGITITKATLSVNAVAKSKIYGNPDPVLTYTFSGFRGGDGPTTSGITGAATMTRTAGETVLGSPYQIRVSSIAGLSAPNYTFAIGATAGLTITPRPITVRADDKFKDEGDPDPSLTYSIVSGSLVPGDAFSGSLTRDPGEGPGSYTIRQGTLGLGANYSLTFQPGTLTIRSTTTTTTEPTTTTTTTTEPTTTTDTT
jgi:serine/threonine-protein kinase